MPATAALMAVPFPFRMPVILVVSVIAGVVVAVATVPANPLAETTLTVVTVPPPPVAVKVPADKDNPEPTVISSTAPVLAVVRPSSRAVVIVRPEPVTAPATTMAVPLSVTPLGKLVAQEGAPEPFVTKTELFAEVRPLTAVPVLA